MPGDVRYCPKCGQANTSPARYCATCGISMNATVAEIDRPRRDDVSVSPPSLGARVRRFMSLGR
jgi:hypothetical protein